MTARSPRASTPRSSAAIAVDLPAPVVPMSLKWRVSSQASRRTPASVRAAVFVRRRRAIARRACPPVRTRAPRLWTSEDPRRSARAPASSNAAASGTESLHWLVIQSIVSPGSVTLDHQVVRGFAVGRCAAVDVYAQPSGGSALPQLDPSALLGELRDVAAQLGSSGAQRRYLGVRGQQPPAERQGDRRRERGDADAPRGEAQARRLLERSQTLSSAPAVLVERAQLFDQRGADLLPHDAIETEGVLAQPFERGRSECLLGFRRLHQEANFHGEIFHGEGASPGVGLEALASVLTLPTGALRARAGRCSRAARGRGGPQADPQPRWARCELQIAGEVGQLLDLGAHDRGLDPPVLGVRDRGQHLERTPRARARDAHDFALTDEARGKLRRAPMLTPRAPQNERVAAVLDDGLRLAAPIGRGHLCNRLKAEHAAPTEFA